MCSVYRDQYGSHVAEMQFVPCASVSGEGGQEEEEEEEEEVAATATVALSHNIQNSSDPPG